MARTITGPMVFCHCLVWEYYAIIQDLSSVEYHVLESVWCCGYHTFRIGGYTWHGNVFHIKGLLWRESSGCLCILSTKMSNSKYYLGYLLLSWRSCWTNGRLFCDMGCSTLLWRHLRVLCTHENRWCQHCDIMLHSHNSTFVDIDVCYSRHYVYGIYSYSSMIAYWGPRQTGQNSAGDIFKFTFRVKTVSFQTNFTHNGSQAFN